jgi:hypothetical protein
MGLASERRQCTSDCRETARWKNFGDGMYKPLCSLAAASRKPEHDWQQTQPPPSFQPPIPRAAAPPAAIRPVPEVKTNPDLITRYNLSSRLSTAEDKQEAEATGSKGWSQNKTERSEILRRKREEMVLAARRKMQEKDQTKAA